MSTNVSYTRPPITEAVLDLRIEPPVDRDLSLLMKIGESFSELSERRELLNFHLEGQMKVSLDPEEVPITSASRTSTGYLFVDGEKKRLCQVRFDGFTLSHLAPYSGWEHLRDEAKRLWETYRSALRPKIVRMAVRYVNRFDLPGGQIDFADFFKTVPTIAPELDTGLDGFFMQVVIPQPSISGKVILNQAVLPPSIENTHAVALDIDLFRDNDVPQTEDDLWQLFEALHVRKNEIFEACITDKARELIQ